MKRIKSYKEILNKVPIDYYEVGVRKNFFQNLWHNHKYSVFKKLIGGKKYHNIIDIGCASGLMTNFISEVFPNSKITGIDAYAKAIKYAKSKYPHIKFRTADAHKLPFTKDSFDLIVCYETVEHLDSPIKALKEIKRVLKKGGLSIIAMDSGNLLFHLVWWIWEKTKGSVWQGAHIHPYHHLELEDIIKNTGFKINSKRFSHINMEVIFLLTK